MPIDISVKRPVIAVTGSAGKTSTKTMIAAIMRTKYITFESSDYWNRTDHTEQHVKLIGPIHRVVVLEYGMAYPGVITRHCELIQPKISVITNVGLAHIGNFAGKIERIAAAKSEIIHGMDPDGVLFVNADDHNSKLLETNAFKGTLKTVGIDTQADYQAKNVNFSENGMYFELFLGEKEYSFSIPIFGRYHVYNALFAIAVADCLGFSPEEIQQGFNEMKKPRHRLDIYRHAEDITIIDDTVHAFPDAMRGAIDVLIEMAGKKKVAVLGSMPGLSDKHPEEHWKIGEYLKEKKVDYIFTYGNISKNIVIGAVAAGFPPDKARHYSRTAKQLLHQDLAKLIEPGWTILVKGASGLNMYDTVRYLNKHFNKKEKR
ncbi:UDP-N-acetylmuramoyl-tripeptide--D-alanyl-D-alanine ligase [Sporotomaculum syntrophicum]|uniref:UDP-N-acetylmuramoyl-tripeptide--D-alanyl-D-alanine ligase n=1 Tax=Sporotomaculum syntrophicum TaxID=182264 RepID=A0A9D2WMX6_9FIRM|nr:UDP-N-acetylmuramoyl-tripeptide--D-alanyl-D-alanine ligase [Sporotomaculum syntrophicum]KAF1083823.1 UDP-N-acetylmuramoyl-tripeptide--D-alanyl-D-alanine ligase [Sporotomaculum syntrophicum]